MWRQFKVHDHVGVWNSKGERYVRARVVEVHPSVPNVYYCVANAAQDILSVSAYWVRVDQMCPVSNDGKFIP